jgi:hypothetical protein
MPNADLPKKPEEAEGREWSDDEIVALVEEYYEKIDRQEEDERTNYRETRREMKEHAARAREVSIEQLRSESFSRDIQKLQEKNAEIRQEFQDLRLSEEWSSDFVDTERRCREIRVHMSLVKRIENDLEAQMDQVDWEEVGAWLNEAHVLINSAMKKFEELPVTNSYEKILKKILLGGSFYAGIVSDENHIAKQALVIDSDGKASGTLEEYDDFYPIGINEYGCFDENNKLKTVAQLVAGSGLRTGGDEMFGHYNRIALDTYREMQDEDRGPIQKLENFVSFVTAKLTHGVDFDGGLIPTSDYLGGLSIDDYKEVLRGIVDDEKVDPLADYLHGHVEDPYSWDDEDYDGLSNEKTKQKSAPWDDPSTAIPAIRIVDGFSDSDWESIAAAFRESVIKDMAHVTLTEVKDVDIAIHDYDIISVLSNESFTETGNFTMQEVSALRQALVRLEPEDLERVEELMKKTKGLAGKFFSEDKDPATTLSHLEEYGDDLEAIAVKFTETQRETILFLKRLVSEHTQLQVSYGALMEQLSHRFDQLKDKIGKGEGSKEMLNDAEKDAMILSNIFRAAFEENPDLRFEDIRGLSVERVSGEGLSGKEKEEMLSIFDLNWVAAPGEVRRVYRKKLIEAFSANDTFYLLKKDSQTAGMVRFQDHEDYVYGTSYNIRTDLQKSHIGDLFINEAMNAEVGERVFRVDSRFENPALGMYMRELGFVGIDMFGISGDDHEVDFQMLLERNQETQRKIAQLDASQIETVTLNIRNEIEVAELQDRFATAAVISWQNKKGLVTLQLVKKELIL